MSTIQIFGGADCWETVPELPEGAERWGLNNLILKPSLKPRFEGWTRWFDLHTTTHIKARKPNVYPWECQQTKPVVRWAVDSQMPSSVVYPLEAGRDTFDNTRLFVSTFDWLMALAIHIGTERIDLYGWEMSHPHYRHQIHVGRWWLQQAEQRGVVVVNYSRSQLFSARYPRPPLDTLVPQRMYGLETD